MSFLSLEYVPPMSSLVPFLRPFGGIAALGVAACSVVALAQEGAPAAPVAGAEPSGPATPAAHPADAGEDEDGAIVVTAQRQPGAVIGDIAPEVSLNPGDIRSYGVSSLSELMSELAPQTGSGQGRGGESPVMLLNGQRISGFAELRDIPVEAIRRVDILPEEVALKYGYRPNQKVVNIVLRNRFRATTGEVGATVPTEGDRFSPQANLSYLRIGEIGRLNLTLDYKRSSALYESDRAITAQAATLPYATGGNIGGVPYGAEIDPALSALTGHTTTVAGVPATAADGTPALADFAAAALNQTDTRRYRTLLPETDALTFNAVLARTLFDTVSASFNASFAYEESDSAQGLASAVLTLPQGNPYSPFAADTGLYRYLGEFGALGQASRDWTGHLGTTLNGAVAPGWQWSFTGTFDRTVTRTQTDRGYDLSGVQARLDALDPTLNPFAPLTSALVGRLRDEARSATNVGDAQWVVTGSPLSLPAGAITTTMKLGATLSDLSSRSTRSAIPVSTGLSRDDFSGQFSVDLPIASRTRGVLAPLGQLSANFNLAYNHLSDFGGLNTIGAGLTWTPVKPLNVVASWERDDGAPTMAQIGGPEVTTSGVRVFDYVRGETVDIARISGGNPDLAADTRRVYKLGATLKPLSGSDLSITANYLDSRIANPIAAFPTATAAIEAAFPDRFVRDAQGQLLSIDSRPINFARQEQRQFRWGFNFSKRLSAPNMPTGFPLSGGGARAGGAAPEGAAPGGGATPAGGASARSGTGGPGAGGSGAGGAGTGESDGGRPGMGRAAGAGGPPPGGFRGRFGGGTRLQVAVYHTVHLRDRITVFDGGPVLDLLHGDAIGSGGGQPRHEVEVQTGLMHNGFGLRLSGDWQSATTVTGGTGSSETLHFGDLATVNLRLFANLGQMRPLVSRWSFLRGARIALSVTNLFNSRQHVRNADGVTPVSYQPDYLDPLGRTVRLTVRKMFF